MDLRERYIETNGVKLHVMESGPADGPMVLFLHGFPEFWYAWRKQIGYFAERGYLVVVPDQRGYNLSDKPKGIAPYKIDELAKDAIGLIDFYKRDKVFLVGHDWGAAVSWWVAIKYPERISRLVIMNVPHTLVFRKHLFGTQKQMEKSWYIFYFQIPGAVEVFASANDFQWPLDLIVESAPAKHLFQGRAGKIPGSVQTARRFFFDGELVPRGAPDALRAACRLPGQDAGPGPLGPPGHCPDSPIARRVYGLLRQRPSGQIR